MITPQLRIDVPPGRYTGLLTTASEVNAKNALQVTADGHATVFLDPLSSLVVWSQQSNRR